MRITGILIYCRKQCAHRSFVAAPTGSWLCPPFVSAVKQEQSSRLFQQLLVNKTNRHSPEIWMWILNLTKYAVNYAKLIQNCTQTSLFPLSFNNMLLTSICWLHFEIWCFFWGGGGEGKQMNSTFERGFNSFFFFFLCIFLSSAQCFHVSTYFVWSHLSSLFFWIKLFLLSNLAGLVNAPH